MVVRMLAASPLASTNYRGSRVARPLGVVVAGAAIATLVAFALAGWIAHRHLLAAGTAWAATFALGVALLGLLDDAAKDAARGVRGHLRALCGGRADTGAIKAAGTLALALLVLRWSGAGGARLVLAAAVLVLAPHVFNLLDVRPGRSIKAFAIIAAGAVIGTGTLRPLAPLSPFVGGLVVVAFYDLRERGMLGDAGASLLGALAGLWLVLALSTAALAGAAVALAVIAVYGEVRSISGLLERVALLRHLDSVGRLP
jgi:hypothetical protein